MVAPVAMTALAGAVTAGDQGAVGGQEEGELDVVQLVVEVEVVAE